MPPIEAIIAPLEAELKLARLEVDINGFVVISLLIRHRHGLLFSSFANKHDFNVPTLTSSYLSLGIGKCEGKFVVSLA